MKKLLLAFTIAGTIALTNSFVFAQDTDGSLAADRQFTDIANHWAETSINKVVDKEAFMDKDGKFLPDREIKRSEFVTMLHKTLDIRIAYFKAPDIGEFYDDVKNEDVYVSALYDLVTTGVIDDKGQFRPDSAISREEAVHYIMKAYRYKMGDNYRMINIVYKPFADDELINPVYSGEIARADNMGIVVRPESNLFYPKDDTSRAQSAALMDRLLTQLEKENLQVKVTPNVEVKDGSLKMKLTIINNLKTKIVMSQSSGQKYDFKLLDSDRKILYTWSADKMFTMALTEVTIEPGETVEYSADLEKEALENVKGKAVYMKGYIVGQTDAFVIDEEGYETQIDWE